MRKIIINKKESLHKIIVADALAGLRGLPDELADMCVSELWKVFHNEVYG